MEQTAAPPVPSPRAVAAPRSPRLLQEFGPVFHDFPVPTALLSLDGTVVRVNAAACAMAGVEESAALGRDVLDLTSPEDREAVATSMELLRTGAATTRLDAQRWVGPEGELRLLVARAAVLDEHGAPALVLQQGVVQDADVLPESDAWALRSAEALVRLDEALSDGELDVRAVAAVALDTVVEALSCAGAVLLAGSSSSELEVAARRAPTRQAQQELLEALGEDRLRLDAGWPAEVLAAGDDGAEPVGSYAGLLVVPLRRSDRVLGLVALTRTGHECDVPRTAFVRQVARRLAVALADAALRDLERAGARRERVLAAVSRTMDEALRHPESMLQSVVETVAAQLGGPCGIALVGSPARVLGACAVSGVDPAARGAVAGHLLAQRPGGFVDRVLRQGSAHVSDGRVGDRVAWATGLERGSLQIASVHGVRLTARGEPLGVLVVGRVDGDVPVEDRRLVDAVVDRLGLALDNAVLLAETRASRRRHRALVAHSSDMLLLLDADGGVRYASPSAHRVGPLTGGRLLDRAVEEDWPAGRAFWREVLASPGVHPPVDLRLRVPGGEPRVMQCIANNLLHDADVGGVVLTVRDVTDERAAREALERRAAQQAVLAGIGTRALTAGTLEELFDHAVHRVNAVMGLGSVGLLELQPEGDLLVRAGTLEGIEPGVTRVPGGPQVDAMLADLVPCVVQDYLAGTPEQRAMADLYGVRSGALLPVVVDGQPWGVLSCHTSALHLFEQVEVDFLSTVCTALAGAVQRATVEGRVRHQATHDALTGLPNRVTLRASLERAFVETTDPFALLLLDLDDFKDVNDSLGHVAGDDVLSQLGARLRAVVGPAGTVARLGGDEFAVCLTGSTTEREAVAVATSIVTSMQEPFRLPGLDVTLGASIGIAVAPEHGTEPGRLLQHADLAMYRAKGARSGWALFDPALDRERSERLSLLVDLREALAGSALQLHYQPLVDLRTGQVREVEALVRWHHPVRGLLLPDVFVPLAEQTDLIDELTLHVAALASAQAGRWRQEGYDVGIALNVSPATLRDRRVVGLLGEALRDAAGALSVEITESALVDGAAREAVVALSRAGARCAVDDFGTGYSALSYLRSLPVSRIKVDRAFSARVHVDERDAALVGGVVRMAHDLGLEVVAEGVETAAVERALRALDVDVAQGWLYGRAAAPEALDRSAWRRA